MTKKETSYGVDIPHSWKYECLRDWMSSVAQYMRANPDLFEGVTLGKRKRFNIIVPHLSSAGRWN